MSGLEPNKWPQLKRFYAYDEGWPQKREHRNAFLVPHLNVEALTEEKTRVLSLLSNRVIYEPEEFFLLDRSLMEMAITEPILGRDFNANCVVVSGDLYGQLREWSEEPMHRGELSGYPIAKLVLEAQSIVMHTLKTIVEAVLEDVPDGLGDAEWRAQVAEGFFPATQELASSKLEHPYGPPPVSCLEEIEVTVLLHLDLCADELQALKCDPRHAHTRVRELRAGKNFNKMSSDNRCAWLLFFIYGFIFFSLMVEACA